MQKINFIDRDKELNFLHEMLGKAGGLVIIYGRRRVGKTELIKQFISGKIICITLRIKEVHR